MRASSVKGRIPADIWQSYYKFTFERNPWDKVISFYFWYGRSKQLPEFNQFVQNHRDFGTMDQVLPSDWTRYTLHNDIIVDDVFDFDDLGGNLRLALSRAGVAPDVIETVSLGSEKTSLRKRDPIPLDAKTDAIIRKVFACEINRFPFCSAPKADLFATAS